jgi:septum formation protein
MREDSGTIILASSSPRRAALLASAGVHFTVVASSIAEQVRSDEVPEDSVLRLAIAKARDVAKTVGGRFFLGADTAVVIEGEIMGKPRDRHDAERMLMRLSGRVHEVITGYEVYDKHADYAVREVVKTRVFFKTLRVEEIRAYVASETPFDKAGAYAIQERAAFMVHRIEGSYTNVVGLPLCEVVETLVRMGAISWPTREPGGAP